MVCKECHSKRIIIHENDVRCRDCGWTYDTTLPYVKAKAPKERPAPEVPIVKGCSLMAPCIAVVVFIASLLIHRSIPQKIDMMEKYFGSWSFGDMPAYRECFHPDAVIHFVKDGEVGAYGLKPFFDAQCRFKEMHPDSMEEGRVTSVQYQGDFMQIVAQWKIMGADVDKEGTDCFTFWKIDDKWKIISLVYDSRVSDGGIE